MTNPAFTLSEPDTLPVEGRKKLDQYFTPEALAVAAVGWLKHDGYIWPDARVLEPSAGRGSWVKAVQLAEPLGVLAVDLDPERVAELEASDLDCDVRQGDFATYDFADFTPSGCVPRFDVIIGNPPYNAAESHTRRALALRERFGVVAFLLRLAFLESAERIPFWREHPASKVYVLSERPSFSGGATDNSAYGIFVWATWHRGPTEVEVVQWKGARANG